MVSQLPSFLSRLSHVSLTLLSNFAANFRYFSEMLSAQFLGGEIDEALNEFRESHSGTLSGMTRFRDHLDDMPANVSLTTKQEPSKR